MREEPPPQDYEALIRLIHERHGRMSRAYRRIAVYLTQNPGDVAVVPLSGLAERCGVHASSFVRFAQSLGYGGFRELQALFQRRLVTAAPGFEARVRALEEAIESRADRTDLGLLKDLVVQDIASLQELLDGTKAADLARAADLIGAAGTVYLLGQLRSAPVVDLMRYLLTMVGKPCVLLDPGGGLATHMARTMRPGDVLVAVSFRFYANEVVAIVEEAARAGQAVIVMTDSTLSPVAKAARVLFTVPEHSHAFSRSLAAPMCLAQALAVAVAARRPGGAARIPTVTEA